MSDLIAFVNARLDREWFLAREHENHAQDGPSVLAGRKRLREVEAMRKILTEYAPAAPFDGPSEPEYAYGWAEGLGMAVRALAAIWNDHKDYEEGWKP